MNDATIHTLNAINQRFYATVAVAFDATRQQAWRGWERIVEIVEAGLKPHPLTPDPSPTQAGRGEKKGADLHVLDVGCGNGRFGVFLADRLGSDGLHYHGIDSSAALIERAKLALAGIDATFEQRDLIEQPLDASLGQFDLIALFGVLHHIPGADRRRDLLRTLADHVAEGGWLAFSEWRFYEQPNLRERIIPWSADLQVEAGDYLLDWRRGETAYRYCHYVDDAEHAQLVESTGLTPLAEYRADAANLYTILSNVKSAKST